VVQADHLDTRDLWPLLTGKVAKPAPCTLYWRTPAMAALRDGDGKLVVRGKDEKAELFDLAADPNEQNDSAAAHPEQVKQLRELLEQQRRLDR